MSAKQKDPLKWNVSPDMAFHLIMPLATLVTMTLVSKLITTAARHLELGWVGLAVSLVAVVLLFVARLPLYRQRRWFTMGPRHLSGIHRRLYFAAYLVLSIGAVLMLLAITFARP